MTYTRAYTTTAALTSEAVGQARFGEVRRGGLDRLEVYAFLRRVEQTMRGVEYRREAEWHMVDMLWQAQKTLEDARKQAARYRAQGGTPPDPEALAVAIVSKLFEIMAASLRTGQDSEITAAPRPAGQDS